MSVLNEFKAAIAIQQRKENEEYDEQMKLPIEERVAKGNTMNNIKVVFDFYDHAPNNWCPHLNYPLKFIRSAKIFCKNNISTFREGGQVLLSNGTVSFKMDIIEDTVENFILAPNDYDVKFTYIDSENYNPNNWEINTVKTDLTLKLLTATAGNLENDNVRLQKIERLLSGNLINTYTPDFQYASLNPSQSEALRYAIRTSDFHLIQGPPGTGKTETIAHIAKILVEQGKKVFVTASTHTAINNCLNAIANKIKDKSKVLKIGEKYQAAEILVNDYITRKSRFPLSQYNYDQTISQGGLVIGGTPYCFCYPASKRLDQWEFDVALIDEAAQLSIPLAVSVMSKTDKFIFVGDHKQLEPIMPSGTGMSMFSESVFSRLVRLYPNNKSLLNISYRLSDRLIRIPNDLFYNNELRSECSLDGHQAIHSNNFSAVINHQDPKVLYLHKVFDSQGRSEHEASIVAEIVHDLLAAGVQLKDIGILTPYRAQVREIKKAIASQVNNVDFDTLFVDTVDRMQGQERDYIIYSMSNSHPLESKRRLDFFYSPNRLNVAITRGIKKCIVIANYKVFDIIDEELVDIENYDQLKPSLDVFKNYLEISSIVEEEANEVDW